MHYYKVTQGPLTLPPGLRVRLNEQQASLRAYALKKCANEAFEVILPIQFKTGEIMEFDELPDKTILATLFSFEKIKEIKVDSVVTSVKPPSKGANQTIKNRR